MGKIIEYFDSIHPCHLGLWEDDLRQDLLWRADSLKAQLLDQGVLLEFDPKVGTDELE